MRSSEKKMLLILIIVGILVIWGITLWNIEKQRRIMSENKNNSDKMTNEFLDSMENYLQGLSSRMYVDGVNDLVE